LHVGDAVRFVARVTAFDPAAGMTLDVYGPLAVPEGTMTIAADGTFTGALARPAAQVPVQLVPRFAVVSAGDVLIRGDGTQTAVVRRVNIEPDGTYLWSPGVTGPLWYGLDGWGTAGHIDIQ